jgi:intein-encoded DNA endonuclease-like protein
MTVIPREVSDQVVGTADQAYVLGLWCADSYWWSSSIGISNVEPELVVRFAAYLRGLLDPERLRIRVYEVKGDPPDTRVLALTTKISIRPAGKARRTAYHAYVNSRALVRRFQAQKARLEEVIPEAFIGPYFAGRFDGDGSWGSRPRVAYTTREEAEVDARMLARAKVHRTSVLTYRDAGTVCVYIHRSELDRFRHLIEPWSWKMVVHPVETAMASLAGGTPPNL